MSHILKSFHDFILYLLIDLMYWKNMNLVVVEIFIMSWFLSSQNFSILAV